MISMMALVMSAAFAMSPTEQTSTDEATEVVIAIHGGGGIRDKSEMPPELEAAYREALQLALETGYDVLSTGGSSVSAVEAAIRVMEDSPLFNAGKGASFNAAGIQELDASIMSGSDLDAGAVMVVQRVKNPISLAREVMEKTPHVAIAGEGALELAKQRGLDVVAPHYFFTERKWDSLQRRLKQGTEYGKRPSQDGNDDGGARSDRLDQQVDVGLFGTVGAVALDRNGNLAAGTSTGGREGKMPGRVGDSPIIGAGTYAKNSTLAVSSTGLGEYVIRVGGTKTMSDLMEYKGLSLQEATNAVKDMIEEMGGAIGVVALDRQGNVAMPYSGNGMYRGYLREGGEVVVQIYE